MGKLVDTAQAALKAVVADQLVRLPDQAAWDALTSEQKVAEWDLIGRAKYAVTTATKKESGFYTARQAAFNALTSKYQTDLSALQLDWQAQEDALIA